MEFSVALADLWKFVSRTNKYIDETQPWVLAKDEDQKDRLGNVMAHLAESLRQIGVMLQPFLTQTPERIFKQLGVQEDTLKTWDSLSEFGAIPAGTTVQKDDPIFPRLDAEEETQIIKDMMKKPEPKKEEKKPVKEEQAEEVTIDDFMKLDFRVAEIMKVDKVKKADKLLKIQLDLGYEQRQVVSGIAEHYDMDDLHGRKVICITNLKPVKLRGELSQGMILAGEDESGKLALASIDQTMSNGTKVK